ncbi:hydroxyethylthiazole kinase [Alkalibacillus almallahensis]|uniref:hydroxyethylthiazole kinase n=1 Tax=Alkalibacillus almallahensis TaxID=1379154 RepID=UPI00141F7A7F|nr:hydroxyethylthiazole kinase [Alkalibacillus almallahensis]NIK11536.1 hydroxyethylthiazole kinase [Alkalibacillus almallahensis]
MNLEQLREERPLVHHITNEVVMNFTANGLLAFGGSPVMSKEKEEIEEMAGIANAIVLNIGTVRKEDLETMIKAGKTANKAGVLVLLDPVGAGATTFRKQAVQRIMNEVDISVVKGNAGEIGALADIPLKVKGVDSEEGGDVEVIALEAAKTLQTMVVVTGETDVISDGKDFFTSSHGTPLLGYITGAGCLLGSLIAACISIEEEKIEAVQFAINFYNKAAERAEKKAGGPGTFIPHLLDELGDTDD